MSSRRRAKKSPNKLSTSLQLHERSSGKTKSFRSASESGSPRIPKPSDNILDPARQILIQSEEAKRKRKSDETYIALEKIQQRIDYTLGEYEGLGRKPSEEFDNKGNAINMEMVENSEHLYDLLADPQARSKYHQKLTVFIVGYEEKHEDMERVLLQLQDFFVETQAGGTAELLEKVAEEELNLDEATEVLDEALATAQNSVQKLVGIKKEMKTLMSIVSTYPDSKQGRKKMEKALVKAQEDIANLSNNLNEVQANLLKMTENCSQLQVQLDVKTQECTKLRKTSDQIKLLQVGNESLKRDLATAQIALKDSQEELTVVKDLLQVKSQTTTLQDDDKKRITELEEELKLEKDKYQKLVDEMEVFNETHKKEMEVLKAEHEAEDKEVRGRFEEQLNSLMEEDIFGEEESGELQGDKDDGLLGQEEGGSTVSIQEQEEIKEDDILINEETAAAPIDHLAMPVPSSGASTPRGKRKARHIQEMKDLTVMYESREKELQNQAQEFKTKSRSIIEALQAQLADAKSQHATVKGEMDEMNELLTHAHQLNEELNKRISALEEEKFAYLDVIKEREIELQQVRKELQETKSLSLHQLSYTATPIPPLFPRHSPLVPMEEVVDGESESQIFLSGSIDLGLEKSRSSSPFAIHMDPAPLGSPILSSSSLIGDESFASGVEHTGAQSPPPMPPQYNLSVLAGSQLSQHSTGTQNGAVNHSHPIVKEWSKAYESLIKFKENLIVMLREHEPKLPQLSNSIEELRSLELHSINKKQDVQEQITEMRFSLALLLHQIEQTLQESFVEMMCVGEDDSVQSIGNAPSINPLEEKVVHLINRLKQAEEKYKKETEKSKDTITQLQHEVEKLKIKIALFQSTRPQGKGTIMFTRLDFERNTKALECALEKERITTETFIKLTESMEEYLTISSQQFATLSQRWYQRILAINLVKIVHSHYSDLSQADAVVKKVNKLEEKRQQEFINDMRRLGIWRQQLAQSLTNSLTNIEEEVKIFLIKPIFFGTKMSQSHGLIIPISRPFPTPHSGHSNITSARKSATHHRPSAKTQSRCNTGLGLRLKSRCSTGLDARSRTLAQSRCSTGFASRTCTSGQNNVRMIQSLLRSQHEQQLNDQKELITCLNSLPKSKCESPSSYQWFSRQQSPSVGHFRPSSSIMPSSDAADWDVRRSRVWQEENQGDEHPKPSIPKIVELDITRHRQPETLLGHLLPNLHQLSRTYTPVTQRHTPSPQKLHALPEESSQASSNSSHLEAPPKNHRLTTVAVPS